MRRLLVLTIAAIAAWASSGAWAADEWALVRLSVTHIRGAGKESAEMVSQALMGTPLKILEKDGGWWRVESPEGYQGWVDDLALAPKDEAQMAEWRKAPRLVMTNPYQIEAYATPDCQQTRCLVTDLVNGDIVEGSLTDLDNGRVKVTLPDGRTAWAEADCFTPIEKWSSQPFDADVILNQAFACMGAPYLWGGLSTKGTDCSGLVRIGYFANGRILRRDASQQARTGQQLDPTDIAAFQPADLLFFGNKSTGRITHVGLYDRDGYMIHSSGRVRRNSIDPNGQDYYDREILKAVRINGHDNTDGITPVASHSWYF
ncbi:MAG: C40 family peptidase [Bacteroidales bacterium]|nr:C40 family peptidase [Bacteroidales bacterium]